MTTLQGILDLEQFVNKTGKTNWRVSVNGVKVATVFDLRPLGGCNAGESVSVVVDTSSQYPKLVSVSRLPGSVASVVGTPAALVGSQTPVVPQSLAPDTAPPLGKSSFQLDKGVIRMNVLGHAVEAVNGYYVNIEKGGSIKARTSYVLQIAKEFEQYVLTGKTDEVNNALTEE